MRYSKLSTDTESQSSIKEEDDPTSTREASWLKSTNTNLWLLLALVVSLAVNVFLAGRAREETCLTDHRAGGLLSQYGTDFVPSKETFSSLQAFASSRVCLYSKIDKVGLNVLFLLFSAFESQHLCLLGPPNAVRQSRRE